MLYKKAGLLSNPGTMLISMEEYYEGGHSVCRNPVIQKMFVFMGFGEKSGIGADVIAKGWKDNGWSILMVEEKNNPDRIETWLKLGNNANVATEFSTISMEKTQDRVLADNGNLVARVFKIASKSYAFFAYSIDAFDYQVRRKIFNRPFLNMAVSSILQPFFEFEVNSSVLVG